MKFSVSKNKRRSAVLLRALPVVVVVASILATASPSTCQTIYKWLDNNGIIHFSDTPPPADGRLVEKLMEKIRPDILPSPDVGVPSPEIGVPSPDVGEEQASAKPGVFTVARVYDGDSFEAYGHNVTIQVRIVGIDAPEGGRKGRRGQPFSRKATDFLSDSIGNRAVSLKGYGSDSYNRQLAEVFVDGRNVGLLLVEAGLAEAYGGKPPKGFDMEPYKNAETSAKNARLGIWSLGDNYESPYQWRRRMR